MDHSPRVGVVEAGEDLHRVIDGDLWACGVVLYEMVAGQLPFISESTYGVLQAILQNQPKRLRHHAPHAPSQLELIVERALDKEMLRRFQSAAEFIEALRARSDSHLSTMQRTTLPG